MFVAWAGLVLASFWTLGEEDSWDPAEPWFALSMVASLALGIVGGRWWLVLLSLLLLPVGFAGPEFGEPDPDNTTLSDLWVAYGPVWALVYGSAIAVGTAIRKGWDRRGTAPS